jgi:hypothetical protein
MLTGGVKTSGLSTFLSTGRSLRSDTGDNLVNCAKEVIVTVQIMGEEREGLSLHSDAKEAE